MRFHSTTWGKSLRQAGTANESQKNSAINGLILVLNAGSSSLKFTLYDAKPEPLVILTGNIERIGQSTASCIFRHLQKQQRQQADVFAPDHVAGLNIILGYIKDTTGVTDFTAIGQRVVHGGPHYTEPQLISSELLMELRGICPLASEHLPVAIALLDAVQQRFPTCPQIACFDTAFHRDLPRVARLFPIPRRYETVGIRRYGFHGLSYEYLLEELHRLADPAASRGRVILAHLGNGASLAAVRNGRCIDTSMGFTPTAGLMMGTRSGDLDPGLLCHLVRSEPLSANQLQQMLNHASGLLGVSETSSDLRDLLTHEGEDERSAEAIALFCYQAKKWLGAFAAALGGLDTLVFSGGIGTNASVIRTRICAGLEFLGIDLDERRNANHAGIISADTGRVIVRVIRTDEELMIARSVCRVLQSQTLKSTKDISL